MYRAVTTYDLCTAAGTTTAKTGAKLLTGELAQAIGDAVNVGNVPWIHIRLPRADGASGWVPNWVLGAYSPGLGTASANGIWMGGYVWNGPDGAAPRTHDSVGANPGLAAYTKMPIGAAVEVLTDPTTPQPIAQSGDGSAATTSGGGAGTTTGGQATSPAGTPPGGDTGTAASGQAGSPAAGGFWYIRNAAQADVSGWYESKWVQPGAGTKVTAATTAAAIATTSSSLSVADELKTVFPNGFPVCFMVDYQKQAADETTPSRSGHSSPRRRATPSAT